MNLIMILITTIFSLNIAFGKSCCEQYGTVLSSKEKKATTFDGNLKLYENPSTFSHQHEMVKIPESSIHHFRTESEKANRQLPPERFINNDLPRNQGARNQMVGGDPLKLFDGYRRGSLKFLRDGHKNTLIGVN